MPYATVNGLRTYFDREGSGRPMLMIHGAAQDSTSWRYNLQWFANRYDAIAVDLPGHGKSQLPPTGPISSVTDYAARVWALSQELHLERPIIVGHSMAGAIALRIGVEHSTDIAAVVDVDGAASTAARATSYNEFILDAVSINPTDWMETTFLSLLGRTTPLERKREMASDARRVAPEVALSDLHAYTSCDFSHELSAISVPVFVLVGEDDWSCTPALAKQTFDLIQSPKEYLVWESLGHIPHTEQPDVFNETLSCLLEKYDL